MEYILAKAEKNRKKTKKDTQTQDSTEQINETYIYNI